MNQTAEYFAEVSRKFLAEREALVSFIAKHPGFVAGNQRQWHLIVSAIMDGLLSYKKLPKKLRRPGKDVGFNYMVWADKMHETDSHNLPYNFVLE